MGWYPCCCSDCTYEASDGSLYSNSFGAALDGGWTQIGGTDLTFQTSGGLLQGVGTVGSTHTEGIRRSDTMPGTWTRIIQEIEVHPYNSNTTISGINMYDSTNTIATLLARWSVGDYRCITQGFSDLVSQTPVDGDLLSIIVETTAGGFRVCFFVNEVEIFNREITTVTIESTFFHQIQCAAAPAGGPDTYGEWDNYTIQIDS